MPKFEPRYTTLDGIQSKKRVDTVVDHFFNLSNKTSIEEAKEERRHKSKEAFLNQFFNPISKDESSFKLTNISLDRITPRPVNQHPQIDIEKMAESIVKIGRLIYPVVLANAKDLPKESKLYAIYQEQGVDIETLDLVIVAGDLRFRAFKLLRGNDDKKVAEGALDHNRFGAITTNILSPEEAKNIDLIYEDSNM